MKPEFKKKLEKIGQKLGYKTLRYGHPYMFCYLKNRKKIANLKQIVNDKKSIDVINSVLKSNMSRNFYRYSSKVYNNSENIAIQIDNEIIEYHPNHYFEPGIIMHAANDVFVDVGAYLGETSLNFIEKSNNDFKKIHVFEALRFTYNRMIKNLTEHHVDFSKVKCHPVGLASENKKVFFSNNFTCSKIDKEGTDEVELVQLDTYLSPEEKDEITFIKMDIEGAEMDALRGMQEIIKKNKPKLAISIYHLKDDLWNIPFYIKELNPSYNLYIRQYDFRFETICYAI